MSTTGPVCICCGAQEASLFRTVNGHPMWRCANCGFVQVHPLPTQHALDEHYDRTRTTDDKRALRLQLLDRFLTSDNNPKRDFFDRILAAAVRMSGASTLDILEVGSGFGVFVHYANTAGHRAVGTEVTETYARMSSEGLNGRILHVPDGRYADTFAPASFDLILMEHVLEHTTAPAELLAQLRVLLRPQGVLVVAVPNFASLISRWTGRWWSWGQPPEHLFHYSPHNLGLLLERHGFAVAEREARDFMHRSIPQLFSLRRPLNMLRKVAGLKAKPFHYAYPRTPGDHLLLAPYHLLSPWIRRSWKQERGSEIVIFARPRP